MPPNKRLQSTIASVTPCADAQVAPATLAAEANVRWSGREMRTTLLAALVLVLATAPAMALEETNKFRSSLWGAAAGIPQLIALTLETHQDRPLRLQVSAGTVVQASSMTGRLVFTRTSGSFRPYMFAGGGLFNVSEGDGAHGTTTFAWGGGGLTVPVRSLLLYYEVGFMGGLDTEKGFAAVGPALAIGVMFGQ